jgi:hypothetical protein
MKTLHSNLISFLSLSDLLISTVAIFLGFKNMNMGQLKIDFELNNIIVILNVLNNFKFECTC